MTTTAGEAKMPLVAWAAEHLRGQSTRIARLGKPPSEQAFETVIQSFLEDAKWGIFRQVRRADGSRLDLVCVPPLSCTGSGAASHGPIIFELKMRLDASQYKQFDRYLKRYADPLIAVGWQASPAARRTLRDLATEMPDRFQAVVVSDGASLA